MASRKKTLAESLDKLLTVGTVADGATVAPAGDAAPDADDDTAGGYARTSTGYRRGDGETVRRVSLMLTERQRRDLRRLAAGSENVTEYVVEALGLGRTNGPGPAHPGPPPARP